MARTWSQQQQAFLDWAIGGNGSCVLEAVAGAGKTTVLLEAAATMRGQVAICAYNRKIADEVKAKLVAKGIDWKKAQANTVHGFGRAALKKAFPNFEVNSHKVDDILDVLAPVGHLMYYYRAQAAKLVSLAKQTGIGIAGVGGDINDTHAWLKIADHYDVFNFDTDQEPPIAQIVALAQAALVRSNSNTDTIDFDDMVYLPLVKRLRFWQFDVVMVDEAQDTNATRRALVRAMLKKGGRVIAVGDRHQAIYGFTGADADSLDLIAKDFNCVRLPLTITYRCPKTVVAFAQQWVSHIQAAETAPEGATSTLDLDAFLKRNDLNGEAAVLCRVNKPLVSLAFSLIRRRIPCKVEGREIGTNLKKLLTRWKVTTLDALSKKLDVYLERETTKLLAGKKEAKLAEVEDQVETARVIIDQCRTEKKYNVSDAVAYVDSLFADDVTKVLVLSSIHKAKGREWNRVFWLDRAGTCPSKWARQLWQQGQEINLQYVAATRAIEELIDLTVDSTAI